MTRERDTMVRDWEDAVQQAAQELLDDLRAIQDLLGPRPFGWAMLDHDATLEDWIEQRADPAALGAQVAAVEAVTHNRLVAERACLRHWSSMERALAQRGEWDGTPEQMQAAIARGVETVVHERLARHIRVGAKAAEAAERVLRRPAAILTEPVVLPPEIELLKSAVAAHERAEAEALGLPADDLDVDAWG